MSEKKPEDYVPNLLKHENRIYRRVRIDPKCGCIAGFWGIECERGCCIEYKVCGEFKEVSSIVVSGPSMERAQSAFVNEMVPGVVYEVRLEATGESYATEKGRNATAQWTLTATPMRLK